MLIMIYSFCHQVVADSHMVQRIYETARCNYHY